MLPLYPVVWHLVRLLFCICSGCQLVVSGATLGTQIVSVATLGTQIVSGATLGKIINLHAYKFARDLLCTHNLGLLKSKFALHAEQMVGLL